MGATRHVPERSCVACRRVKPKSELLRLTRNRDGNWQLSEDSGRGVYLCRCPECWREKSLRRSFGAQAPALSQRLEALKDTLLIPSLTTE